MVDDSLQSLIEYYQLTHKEQWAFADELTKKKMEQQGLENVDSKKSTKVTSEKRIFTRSELSEMRRHNPAEYQRLQTEIMQAYRDKRVVDR